MTSNWKKGKREDEEMSVYCFTCSMSVPLESDIGVPAESVRMERRNEGTSRSYESSSGTSARM